jgi:predicted porin
MKVKLIVAAVAAAFVAPIASADVTISGTFAPLIGNTKTDTTNAVTSPTGNAIGAVQGFSSTFFDDAASRLTIESKEDLGDGNGAGAFLQIRGTNGTFDNFNAENKGLTPFRWGVNVNGGWGKLLVGREFTPYTWTMINNETNMGAIWFGPFGIMGHAGGQGLSLGGGAGTVQHAFFKVGTGLHYYSPDFSGLSFKASWVTDNAQTAANRAITEIGASVDYKPAESMFWLGAAFSRRSGADGAGPMNNLFGGAGSAAAVNPVGATAGTAAGALFRGANGSLNSTDTVILVGGGLALGDLTVGLWYDRVSYRTDGVATGGLSEVSRDAFWIPVSYTLPTGKIGASYMQALESDGRVVGGTFNGSQTGASMIQVSYAHNLSKQTQPYVMLSMGDAGDRSAFNGPFGNGGGLGGGWRSLVVGLQHSF